MKVLVIGKFLPLHNGHIAMFEYASQFGDLHVVIGPRWGEPISASQRSNWIKHNTPIGTKIHIVSYELPSEPHKAPSVEIFWEQWRNEINRVCPNVDIVVSSEKYGERLAKELNAEHKLFDISRLSIPISATQIRSSSTKVDVWNHIPSDVKSYLRKHVAIVGGESCGKTTLVENMVKDFPKLYTPIYEYGRKYMMGRTMDSFTTRDALSIAVHQDMYIQEAMTNANSNPIVLSDTDSLCSMVWAEMADLPISSELWKMSKACIPDLTILIPPTMPWVNDGTREWGDTETRWRFFHTLMQYLELYNREFIICPPGELGKLILENKILEYLEFWNRNLANWRQ